MLLLDRARSTPMCQLPSPSQAVGSGAATGEDEEERSAVGRPNAAADEPRGQGGGGGGGRSLGGRGYEPVCIAGWRRAGQPRPAVNLTSSISYDLFFFSPSKGG